MNNNLDSRNRLEIALAIILILILAGNIYFGVQYFSLRNNFSESNQKASVHNRVAVFEDLFIDIVLRAEGEVSYEDRLKLENAAIATQDKNIIDSWHLFLASLTEEEAQKAVIELLHLFSNTYL